MSFAAVVKRKGSFMEFVSITGNKATIQNICIDGNKDEYSNENMNNIKFSGSQYSKVINCKIINSPGRGIRVDSNSLFFQISENLILDNN